MGGVIGLFLVDHCISVFFFQGGGSGVVVPKSYGVYYTGIHAYIHG